MVAAPQLRLHNTSGLAEGRLAREPTQQGPEGIRYDFNEGCRIHLPAGDWHVQLFDLDTANMLMNQAVTGPASVASSKKYFVRFGVKIWKAGQLVFQHDYDAAGRRVLVQMELGGIGDQIAWVGHAIAFARQHRCELTCCMRPHMLELFRDAYPEVSFLPPDEVDAGSFYATYKLFIFYNDTQHLWQPCDYRQVGLALTAAYILGLSPEERRPGIVVERGTRPVAEPYVCIAVQATSQNKYWNNPSGWTEIVAFLKAHGYRVICIDQKPIAGAGNTWTQIPYGAEDETGNRPLAERARWLRHAAFFVGLSSGLSWLAWAAGCPVVMISGFTHPVNEFHTPYRVINYHACSGCSNDVTLQLDPSDFFWCPRLGGTDRMFECSTLITAEQVKAAIRRIPEFGETAPRSTGKSVRDPAAAGQKVLVFCTSFVPDQSVWNDRYRPWLEMIRSSGLTFDGILMTDDGSATMPGWDDLNIIREGDDYQSSASFNLYHFEKRLGRRSGLDFPGWFRSFTFAARFARANGFDKIVHVESDALLISERITSYINRYNQGWLGFWCPRWNFPETSLQVIAGDIGLTRFERFAAVDYRAFTNRVIETLVPFTDIRRDFVGDRYDETGIPIPEDADYAAQAKMPAQWLKLTGQRVPDEVKAAE